MPTSRTRRMLFSGAAALGVAAGAAGIAGAATSGNTQSQAPAEAEADEQDPSYKSSVTAPEGEGQSEADESKALESLATITADQARDAALAAMPGTAGQVELENENGNVVWSVEVTGADGTVTEVKVDAGNGDVLAQENESDEAGEADEDGESEENEADESGESEEDDEGPEANEAEEAPQG